ncbi:hypothetical protein C0J52_09955 [Blattella germanica]|nr:hypothetical protein C0J52_09955 [Blattella germanica]
MATVVDLLWSCVGISFYIYGIWIYLLDILCCSVPTAGFIALFVFILVHIGRIPPPDPAVVEEVLGLDPLLMERDDKKKDSKDGAYIMKSIGHRGVALDAPENSISAFRLAKTSGVTAVEFDVVLTKDQVPIVFHDDTVDRITNMTGRIKDMTWEDLKQLDISEKHPMKIPLLDDVVKECLELGLRMFMDLKGDDLGMAAVIHDLYKKHKELYNRAVVSTFNPVLLYLIRRGNSNIVGSLAWRPYIYTSCNFSGAEGPIQMRYKSLPKSLLAQGVDIMNQWAYNNLYYHILGVSVVVIHKDVITSDMIRVWKDRGIRVIPWTINLPLEKQYFSRILKVSYFTDTIIGETEMKFS